MSVESSRVAILASGDRESGGGGSTADRVTRDALEGRVNFSIGVVICNNPEGTVGVYDRFAAINAEFGLKGDDRIDVVTINSVTNPEGPLARGQTLAESSAICRLLEQRDIGFSAMLGYLKVLTGEFLDSWCWKPRYATEPGFKYRGGLYHPGSRTSNNHPSILPYTADKHGPGAHELAMDLYHTGRIQNSAMTWHLASQRVDEGPTIAERAVSIFPDDSTKTLGDRVQEVEKKRTALVLQNHLTLRSEHLRGHP
jgi:folate-dependent phosphoribosylglycinamide formyltransferase PurN